MRKNASRQAGFTILEIIATLLVLAVTMAGLITANDRNLKATQRAITREDCTLLAQQRLERALTGLDRSESGDFADFGPQYAPYRWERRDEELEVIGGQKIFRIEITVRHEESTADHPILVTLATYAR